MQFNQLGRTEFSVSSIGMGCVTFGREIDKQTSFEVLDRARERGINLLDTAEAYAAGASETVVGEWLTSRQARDDIVLTTKVGSSLGRQRVLNSAEASLKRLQTDHIDLFQLHSWDDQTPLDETMGALNQLVEQGKVLHIGCSNFAAWQLAKSLLLSEQYGFARMESIQPPYNLVQREIEPETLPMCNDQNIGVLSYSPLGAGFLTGKYRRGQAVPKGTRFDVIPGHQPIYFHEHGYSVLDQLDKAADETGHSLVQLAMAWVIGQSNITSVLIGARNTKQVDQAFEAALLTEDGPTMAVLNGLA